MLPSVPFACAVRLRGSLRAKAELKLGFKHTGNGWLSNPCYYTPILHSSKIQNFSGGACPQTPLAGARCAQPRLIQSSNTRLSNTKMLPTAL